MFFYSSSEKYPMQTMYIKDKDIAVSSAIQIIKSWNAFEKWIGILMLAKMEQAHYSLPLILGEKYGENIRRNYLRTLKNKVTNSWKIWREVKTWRMTKMVVIFIVLFPSLQKILTQRKKILHRYIVRMNMRNSERNYFFLLTCLKGRPSEWYGTVREHEGV